IVQYLDYTRHNVSHVCILESVKDGGIQGFCTGFLTAIALACSREEKDIDVFGAVALRLAMCIGAFIDIDGAFNTPPNETSCLAVRWTEEFGLSRVLDSLNGYANVRISHERTKFLICCPS